MQNLPDALQIHQNYKFLHIKISKNLSLKFKKIPTHITLVKINPAIPKTIKILNQDVLDQLQICHNHILWDEKVHSGDWRFALEFRVEFLKNQSRMNDPADAFEIAMGKWRRIVRNSETLKIGKSTTHPKNSENKNDHEKS